VGRAGGREASDVEGNGSPKCCQGKEKKQHDNGAKLRCFKVGDKVMYHIPGLNQASTINWLIAGNGLLKCLIKREL